MTLSAIGERNNSIWAALEDRLTPLPADSTESSIAHALPAVILFPAGLIAGCFAAACKIVEYAMSFFPGQPIPDPRTDFCAVLEDSRLWKQLEDERLLIGQNNPGFRFGVSTCTFQDSGADNCPHSQWAKWEKKCLPPSNRSGASANLFHLYGNAEGRKAIIDRLHKLGVNSYRFSIEWSHIEPRKGEFDEEKLQVYIDLCKHLRDEGIAPMVTLHHFSEPAWFHEKGGFENEENIPHFIEFAKKIFPSLTQEYGRSPLVEDFCTINEPAIDAFSRFIMGSYSPGVFLNFKRAANYLKGALKAQCVAYEALKKLAPRTKIGFVHQRLSFMATNPLLALIACYFNRIINETTLHFFKSGTFELKIPFICHIREEGFKPKADFLGLQCYARPLIGFTGSTSYHEPMTQMPYREDPESLYEAILEAHEAFRMPIMVTDNGISTHNDTQRARFNWRALYAMQRAAQKIGPKNLRGYYLWSFCDNFEWDMGREPQAFGAYALEKSGLAALPKKGMQPFICAAHSANKSMIVDQ